MLYRLLKIPARIAMHFYCRDIKVNKKNILHAKGPLLIAANHPNSFLDAIIIATLFDKPVYSLVRGDVYINRFFATILTSLNMLPVYRISEGAKNLGHNYNTFAKCREIFKKGGIVLIFSEGRSINEWHLRPLKKGTARLAISSWEDHISLKIMPAGINYQSFKRFGKNIRLNFGEYIHENDINLAVSGGRSIATFNDRLKTDLEKLVIQNSKHDVKTIENKFRVTTGSGMKLLLGIPAFAGYILHIIPYFIIKQTLGRRFRNNDHYDSVMVAGMFLIYPFYLIMILVVLYIFHIPLWWLAVFIVPFCGWSFIKLKKQF